MPSKSLNIQKEGDSTPKALDLTPLLKNKFKPYPRKIGRYSVSDMYAIKRGWITEDTYVHRPAPDGVGMVRMWAGIVNHELIQGLLDEEKCEKKEVLKYNDEIEIVGKADYLPNEKEVWEFKTTNKALNKAKPEHLHQVKAYCSLFQREKGYVMQPQILDGKIVLRIIGVVERDDDWLQDELRELEQFHERVKAREAQLKKELRTE